MSKRKRVATTALTATVNKAIFYGYFSTLPDWDCPDEHNFWLYLRVGKHEIRANGSIITFDARVGKALLGCVLAPSRSQLMRPDNTAKNDYSNMKGKQINEFIGSGLFQGTLVRKDGRWSLQDPEVCYLRSSFLHLADLPPVEPNGFDV